MSQCPAEILLQYFLDGSLLRYESLEIDVHLASCDACLSRIAALVGATKLPLVEPPNLPDSAGRLPDELAEAIAAKIVGQQVDDQ